MFGESHAAERMLRAYGLERNTAFAIVGADVGRSVGALVVQSAEDVDRSAVEALIVCTGEVSSPVYTFETSAAFKFASTLRSRSVRVATLAEPAKVHAILSEHRRFTAAELTQLAYDCIRQDVFSRAHYGYGVMLAAEQARRMGLTSVTIIETGVWNGIGLQNLCEFCAFLTTTQGMQFRVFGFDTGCGLPAPTDWRDHPELWSAGTMVMPDHEALRCKLPEFCTLAIGDVRETIPAFLNDHANRTSPVGFLALDVDLYTASCDVMKLFHATDPEVLLPATIVWVDDSNINVLHTRFAGEALAIAEYNERSPLRKFDHKVVRTDSSPRLWHHCFYFAHIFDHPVRAGGRPFAAHGYFHNVF